MHALRGNTVRKRKAAKIISERGTACQAAHYQATGGMRTTTSRAREKKHQDDVF